MRLNLADKLKVLRKERHISQEKLAQYLNVSFQAVSKWENGNTYPDIALLPDIARFFGITVDELLQVEKIDEEKRFGEYCTLAENLFRNGQHQETLELWKEAYKEMPNNIDVKEMLMSAYYDTDKQAYFNEIVELGLDIYHSDAPMYYKGQAIRELANIYAENGNLELAKKWAGCSISLFNSSDIVLTEILEGDDMLQSVSFCTYWFLRMLFYMANRIVQSDDISQDERHKQEVFQTVANIYELVYQNDDMDFESLHFLYLMHKGIAQMEIHRKGDENTVRTHLNRAMECVRRSAMVEEHTLSHPLLWGWRVSAAPGESNQLVQRMKSDLAQCDFDQLRNTAWFDQIHDTLNQLL